MGARLRGGPDSGTRTITTVADGAGIGLEVWRLNEARTVRADHEIGIVLLSGHLEVAWGEHRASGQRESLFDDRPFCVHAPAGTELILRPGSSGAELLVAMTDGGSAFSPRVYRAHEVRAEQRGKGNLRDAAHREVRTIVDDANGPPQARLVMGEVVTLPGRWSSYPPHHHPQPELYHYRFTRPEGYGHAELSEDVYKVRHGDTMVIEAGETHAQCAAPGYGMWYFWVIRHLDDVRYTVPVFDPEHDWTRAQGATHWWPAE